MSKMVELEADDAFSDSLEDSETINVNGKREAVSADTSGKKRLKTKSLYRQPTANELNRLQETENLFNSNLFRLQIEEVLNEVQVSEKTTKKFQKWFASLKAYLLSIPEDDTQYDLSEQTFVKKYKVKLPVNSGLNKTKCGFRFHKFDDVHVVGSYALGCAINSKLQVDLNIIVPADTYTKNDSINYRYHKKRAAYLAYVASHLNKSDLVENIKYSFPKGCEIKPILLITPKGKINKYMSVCLNLVCDIEAYKLHRFSPVRNNLREHWLFTDNVHEKQSEVGSHTPYYNNSVLSDLTSSVNHKFLEEILGKSENLKQAVVLLKIWIHQRKLQVAGHIVSLFVAYLVQNKRINNIMSSYQIVRNVWISLKSSEWDVKGISLHKGPESTPALEEFHRQFPVVFLDKTGYYNICWQMSKGIYQALKCESSLAVQMLDNGKINSFIPLFMTPYEPLLQYDHIIRFKDVPELITAVVEKTPKEIKLNYGVDQLALVVDVLHDMLAQGLGSRAELITEILDADFMWDIKKTPEKAKLEGHKTSFSFGLILNPDNATNLVDKGPQANLPEAEKFREFWGEKSELRRFQDGTITEACVWGADSSVPQQVVDYLMRYKFGVPAERVFHVGGQADALLQYAGAGPLSLRAAAAAALRALDDLRRHLRLLTDLPLDITAVNGTSAVLSYCEPLPPIPRAPAPAYAPKRGAALLLSNTKGKLPQYTPVIEAVIELGHSGKWPGSLEAFRCVKAAFHLQLAQQLRRQRGLAAQAQPAHVDVALRGLVFRLRVAHGKEAALLRRVPGAGPRAAERLQRRTQLLPRLRGALHGLSARCPALGDTSVVLQRWAAAQLLSGHVPPLVLQLLAAAAWLGAGAGAGAGAGVLRGFARVLRLIADTDWASTVLVLDFNQDLTRWEARAGAGAGAGAGALLAAVGGQPPAAVSRRPAAPALRRLRALAAATLRFLTTSLMHDMQHNILGALIPSYAGYDVLLHLDPALVPLAAERVDRPPRVTARVTQPVTEPVTEPPDAGGALPVVEFHVVRNYVRDLTSAYGEFAVFFYDEFGGHVVAVRWRPAVHERRQFQVGGCHALRPVTVGGETEYRVHVAALVEDFRVLGRGLVRRVTVN